MPQIAEQTGLLIYDAAQQLLSGKLGNAPQFYIEAYSGGSRGHKANVSAKVAEKYLHNQADTLSSHFSTTQTIESEGRLKQRGGTLPAGHYRCQYVEKHSNFGECIQLFMTTDARAIYSPFSPHPIPHHRTDDFFIHGSGPKGSDGCIVPANELERRRLNRAVRDYPGKVLLQVERVAYQLPAELDGRLA